MTATAFAQPPSASSVSEILGGHDRALIRDLSDYLRKHPKADDRDQAFAALFNKAIEHDWFAETENMAQHYLEDEPDGPVKALAQIIITMGRAQAGQYKTALERYKELMHGLGKTDQEEFADQLHRNLCLIGRRPPPSSRSPGRSIRRSRNAFPIALRFTTRPRRS